MTVKLTQDQISRMYGLYDRISDYGSMISHVTHNYSSDTGNYNPFYIKSLALKSWEWSPKSEKVKSALLEEMHQQVLSLILELDAMNCEIPGRWEYKDGTLIW